MSIAIDKKDMEFRIFSIVGAASGNLVEWFDFYIYAVFAVYFQRALMAPQMSDITQAIYVWGVFAASFFMRPLGSWLFGWMADRYGRKTSMVTSISLMALSSFMFAALPTYASVGMAAPFLLLTVRLLQGLSVGGEYGAVATYMSEIAPHHRRGFYAAFQYVTLAGGQLLASALGILMLAVMSGQQLENGGWRIPFLIAGIVGFLSILVRSHLVESLPQDSADTDTKESGSMRLLFRKYWKSFITVACYSAGGSLAFYTITVYAKTYMTGMGMSDRVSGYVMTVALFVFILMQPLVGGLSDHIGRRTNMLLFSGLLAVFIYPLMAVAMPAMVGSPVVMTLLLIALMALLSFYTSVGGLVKAEMFPSQIRALGVGFAFSLGNALFGGTAPALALQFKEIGIENYFFIYVIVILIICFIFSWRIPKESKFLRTP